jgi:hypothetical protein
MSPSQLPHVGGSTESTKQADASEFAAGFARVEAEVRAVPESELIAINLDLPSAVATVLGALPQLRVLRDSFAKLLGFDLGRFDKLRDYTLALGHAHAMFRGASGPSDETSELADEVSALRDMLEADAMALAMRKILDEVQVTKLRGGSGYKNMAFEVVGLVGLFRERWADIQGRSALKVEELEHAGQLAQELVIAVGTKEQAPVAIGAASLLRQQAFTLFMNAYDDARRAASYLRWNEGDVNDIAPSLFAGRGGRGAPDVPPKPPVPATPRMPAPVPESSGAVPTPVQSTAGAASSSGAVPFVRS